MAALKSRMAVVAAVLALAIPVKGATQTSSSDYTVGTWKLRVRLVPEKSTFMLGEPIYLSFEIMNNSNEDLQVIVGGDHFNWLERPEQFTVQGIRDNGSRVQPQDLPPGKRGGSEFVGPQKIPAGRTYTFSLFLPDWLEFNSAGRYTLLASRTLDIGRYSRDASWQIPGNLFHVDARAEANVTVIPIDHAALGEVIANRRGRLLGADENAALAEVHVLEAIDDDRAAAALIDAIAESSFSVKLAAVDGLARFNTDAALAALQKTVVDFGVGVYVRDEAERALKMRAARVAADEFLRKSELPAHYATPIFLRMIDHGNEVWISYKKTFRDERMENPADLMVAYNKATGMTRWVHLE